VKTRFIAAAAILLSLGAGAFGHRPDEYLQATILSVEKDRVQVSMRLIPGVAVSSIVLTSIDTDGDGIISEAEQKTYAERVLRDLSISVDGKSVSPKLISLTFPAIEGIKEGLGEIKIEFTVDLPRGGPERRIVFENHHRNQISAYLVNCLVPSDPDIRILTQNRNETQSFYQLDYAQAGSSSGASSWNAWSTIRGRMGAVGFVSIFRLGMRHIAEGTDHLLFLLALLLPAPLLSLGSRWAGFAGARHSVFRSLWVVPAFTVGHSITLALAALGLVRVPARPIEVLIAVSILISAIHALRPLFPGREAAIAAFFGLIHGLAFASTLGELGLGRWERVTGILAFNLGIETMQLIVVAAIMPSLVLMSRTRAYPSLRIGGALFAGFASLGWTAERLLDVHNSVDVVVNFVAHYAVWIAGALFLISLGCCWLRNYSDQKTTTTAPFVEVPRTKRLPA
jgi:hydrogenase/urease accessory protein HupE